MQRLLLTANASRDMVGVKKKNPVKYVPLDVMAVVHPFSQDVKLVLILFYSIGVCAKLTVRQATVKDYKNVKN